jgi:predicted GIY-YIG superfamily endonuclease
MFQFYGLIDPLTKELRYIGVSANYLERYAEHLFPSNLIGNSHKENWIKSLLANDSKPEIVVLEEAPSREDALEREVELIEYYRFIGCDLTNGTLGGEGRYGFVTPENVKDKISRSMKGKNTKPKITAICLYCKSEFQFFAKYAKRGHKFCSLIYANRHNNSLRNR